MKPHVRAAMAAIALGHSRAKRISSVYDYSAGGYVNIDVKVAGNRADAFDFANGCHVSGSLESLYHYGESSHLQMTPRGNRYNGYDYGSSSHFEITVKGNRADFYDYGTSEWISFST